MFLIANNYFEIKTVKGKGRGVFAKKDINRGVVIGDYIGIVLKPEDAIVDESNFYLMYYSDRAVIVPDLNQDGVHLLNNSCNPNAWLYVYRGHTLAFALNDIKKGEEITIPYLLAPKTTFCEPCLHVCLCKESNCSGSMHMSQAKYKKWREITEHQSKQTKRERIIYGKCLKVLKIYPIIEQNYIDRVKDL